MAPVCKVERRKAYRLNPSFDRRIVHEFLPVVCFQDELVIQLREGDSRVTVEFGRIQREVARGPDAVVGARRSHWESESCRASSAIVTINLFKLITWTVRRGGLEILRRGKLKLLRSSSGCRRSHHMDAAAGSRRLRLTLLQLQNLQIQYLKFSSYSNGFKRVHQIQRAIVYREILSHIGKGI